MYIIEVIDSGIYFWKEWEGCKSWTNSIKDAAKFETFEDAHKKYLELVEHKSNIRIIDISSWTVY